MDSLLFGSTSRAITATLGISSRTRSSRFADSTSVNKLTPVALRPGRLKLTTMPSCIGSPEIKTVGISLVAPLAASSEGDAPVVTITATRRRTRSAAISRSRSYRPSRPTVFDDDVLTLNVAGFIQAPMKRGDELCEGAGRLAVEESNHRHRRLLGVRRARPCCHAAEEGDEF